MSHLSKYCSGFIGTSLLVNVLLCTSNERMSARMCLSVVVLHVGGTTRAMKYSATGD